MVFVVGLLDTEQEASRCGDGAGDCCLYKALDTSLVPWPGMRHACVRLLELYGKVFDQTELCQLIVRKTCNSCKCPRESHDVFHEEWVNVRERLGIGQDQDKWGSRDRVISQGLSWAPPGLPPYKVDQYYKCLPQDKVPKLGTSGEKYREKQLMIQLPKQDLALAYCRHVDPAHHTSYDDFITARNEIALDIAYAKECTARTDCPECGRSVNPGEVGVLAPKFGDKILWHPACFICSHCKHLLVDLTYCVHDDYLYCERHYAEQLKPRCSACDEVSSY
ncbi:hypothetical protein GE061_012532 [Apolygus lucorum]|uniref:LIM zinc-binding domain-containing protein n=1 Tax=Apolygus lucorum TaxID=248454 RepID=A0A6A4JTB9_APOLU|nr:hypothetical protein GE061_012532 [Apolygus lucorum]